jgi:hypothetical protein
MWYNDPPAKGVETKFPAPHKTEDPWRRKHPNGGEISAPQASKDAGVNSHFYDKG